MDPGRYTKGELLSLRKIAAALQTTVEEVARSAGLGPDSSRQLDSLVSDNQRRLREMIEIINKVEPRFGSALIAYAWYRSQPLAGFSGWTAMQLAKEGRAGEVLEYVDAVDAGAYA